LGGDGKVRPAPVQPHSIPIENGWFIEGRQRIRINYHALLVGKVELISNFFLKNIQGN